MHDGMSSEEPPSFTKRIIAKNKKKTVSCTSLLVQLPKGKMCQYTTMVRILLP